MTFNLSSVFDLNGLLNGLINEDVSEVDFLLSEISFGAEPFSLELKRESFFSAGDVAIRNTLIGIGLSRAKSNRNRDFAIGPDFAY